MSARLRIAVVGAGSMGSNHARIIASSDRAALAGVVDPRPEAGSAVAERFGVPWKVDLADLGDVDAVVIAASTEHHKSLAQRVLGDGRPVLVEKPLCASLADTQELVDLSARLDVPLMCGLLERYNPAFLVAKSMLSDPLYVRAQRHSPYAPRIKTGVAWDLLVHDVDLIAQVFAGQELSGLAVEVGRYHPLSESGAEDVIEASLRFDSGHIASASASRVGQLKVRSLVIHELDRMLEVDLLRRGVTAYRHTHIDTDGGTTFRQATEIEIPEVIGREPLATQLDRFIDLVAGTVDADLERQSVLPAHRIVERALEASQTVPTA